MEEIDVNLKKKCSTCHIDKNLSEFNKNKSFKSGLEYNCAECKNNIQKLNKRKKIEKQIQGRIKEQQNVDEIWKIIPGFEKYEASNLGKIRYIKYKKLLKMWIKAGYCVIQLSDNNNKKISILVHRIIAQTFIPNPDGKPTVNHKDKHRDNNNVNNLEWFTPKEQCEHKNTVNPNIKKFKRPNLPELPNEIWKVIPNYERYQVSNYGRIKYPFNKKPNAPYRITAGSFLQDGYMGYVVVNDNGTLNTKVHRLVALAFISNPENKPCVNHEDGNKRNNNVTNLSWSTHSENAQHAYDTNLNKSKRAIYQLDSNKNIIKKWDSIIEACRTLNMRRDTISCGLRKGYKGGGFYWVYLDKYDANVIKQ